MADSPLVQPGPTFSPRPFARALAILGSLFFVPLFIFAVTEWRWADESPVDGIVVSVPGPDQLVCRVPSHPELGSRLFNPGSIAAQFNVGERLALWYSPTHPDRLRYYYLRAPSRGLQLSTSARASLASGLALIFLVLVAASVRVLLRSDNPSTPTVPRPSA